MIAVTGLCKTYHVHRRGPGLAGAVKGLFRREYDVVRAVRGLSFRITPGEFVGFIGPNGAGKTTTMKMLSGILYRTAGSVRVLRHDPARREPDFLACISLVRRRMLLAGIVAS